HDPARTQLVPLLRELLNSGLAVEPAAVLRAADAAEAFTDACGLPPSALEQWAGDTGLLTAWGNTRAHRDLADDELQSLRHWLRLVEAVEPLRAGQLTELRQRLLSGQIDVDEAVRSFELGLARASLAERLI